MRRYQPEAPETFWYELVEVFYGEDGRPMMFGNAILPYVSDMDLDIEEIQSIDLEDFVKESIREQFANLLRDIDGRGPILDERDFENGGVYADHPEVVQLRKSTEQLSMDDLVARIREKLDEEDDDDEDKPI